MLRDRNSDLYWEITKGLSLDVAKLQARMELGKLTFGSPEYAMALADRGELNDIEGEQVRQSARTATYAPGTDGAVPAPTELAGKILCRRRAKVQSFIKTLSYAKSVDQVELWSSGYNLINSAEAANVDSVAVFSLHSEIMKALEISQTTRGITDDILAEMRGTLFSQTSKATVALVHFAGKTGADIDKGRKVVADEIKRLTATTPGAADVGTMMTEAVRVAKNAMIASVGEGNVVVQYQAARRFLEGDGVERNVEAGLSLCKKAASGGSTQAQCLLGMLYGSEPSVVSLDYSESVKWFRMAANAGDTSAQYFMGIACSGGKGVDKDVTAAYVWFDRAGTSKEPVGEDARNARDELVKNMTSDQLREARRRLSANNAK